MQNCRLPLESSRCERNDLEKYYCKDCHFETDLVVILKQHFREYHRKDTDCVQDQPKNDTVVKSYICQKCTFETYSILMWIKHLVHVLTQKKIVRMLVKKSGTDANVIPLRQSRQQFWKNTTSSCIVVMTANLKRIGTPP
jgi:predicted RNA-binding Zn-ribbon protein involved in translation (DUF1610 family)